MGHISTLKSKIIPSIAAAALALGGAGALHAQGGTSDQGIRWGDNQDPQASMRRGRAIKAKDTIKIKGLKSARVRDTKKAMTRGTDPGMDPTSITRKAPTKKIRTWVRAIPARAVPSREAQAEARRPAEAGISTSGIVIRQVQPYLLTIQIDYLDRFYTK